MDIQQRNIINFNVLYNYLIGTLWFVKENLIKNRTKEEHVSYDQDSTRVGHPHLSIRQKRVVGIERIPMLLGTSRKCRKDNIKVRHTMGDKRHNGTWFGSLLIPYTVNHFLSKDIKQAPKRDVTDDEMCDLKEWMRARGYTI